MLSQKYTLNKKNLSNLDLDVLGIFNVGNTVLFVPYELRETPRMKLLGIPIIRV